MSDGALSQDEIDALLSGETSMGGEPEPGEELDSGISGDGSDAVQSAFQALLSETTESQGSNLSILTGKGITVEPPLVETVDRGGAIEGLPGEVVEVRVDFTEGVTGTHSYYLAVDTASTIAALMMGQSGGDLDDAALSAVAEAVSQITGSLATALGNQTGKTLTPSAPELKLRESTEIELADGERFVRAEYPLKIEGEADSTLTEVFSLSFVQSMVSPSEGAPPAGGTAAASSKPAGMSAGVGSSAGEALSAPTGQDFLGALPQAPSPGEVFNSAPPNVQPVQFGELRSSSGGSMDQGNISLLMDVYMEMTVQLGRTKMPIKQILGIGEGTIIELDKLAGEPVDILVNQKLIAKGEVVVIDENFGVRVTEIISTGMDRLGGMA